MIERERLTSDDWAEIGRDFVADFIGALAIVLFVAWLALGMPGVPL